MVMRYLAALWLMLNLFLPAPALANGKGQWLRKEVTGPAPDFALTDQDGRRVSLRELHGKVALLSFIFTHCPTGCPLTTAKLKNIHGTFREKGLHLVSITIDPDHDTPEVMKEYARRFSADLSSWSFLTGTREEIERVQSAYQVAVARKVTRGLLGEVLAVSLVDHALKIFVIDRSGMKRFEYWGQDFDPHAVTQDLANLLDERP